MKMKLVRLAIVCVVALGLTATNACADTLNVNTNYLGLINDGIPSNLSDSVVYINTLLVQGLNSGPTQVGTEAYTRSGYICPGGCPEAVLTGATKTDTNIGSGINVTGFTYLLAKYDAGNAGSRLWYVGGMSTADIPTAFNDRGQYALSHYSLFNPGTTSVPDGGVTLMLLGGALVGLETLRRKFRA